MRIVLLMALVFLSGGGCGKCGRTSPSRTCVDFVSEQQGFVCVRVATPEQRCTPHFVRRCVRWECL